MRRFILLGMLVVTALASPAVGQTTTIVKGGTATLTDAEPGWSVLDLHLESFFGGPLNLSLQFDRYFRYEAVANSSLHNGATLIWYPGLASTVPSVFTSGIFHFGEFDVAVNPTTLVGSVLADPTNYITVSNSCTPLTPSGYRKDGTPYFGSTWAEIPGYFDTCAPGSYVDVSMHIAHATFLSDPVLATPEPASLALLATGFAGVARMRRRRSRTSA